MSRKPPTGRPKGRPPGKTIAPKEPPIPAAPPVPKASDLPLSELLRGRLEDTKVIDQLAQLVEKGEGWALKLWLAYRFGQPLETVQSQGAITIKVLYGEEK